MRILIALLLVIALAGCAVFSRGGTASSERQPELSSSSASSSVAESEAAGGEDLASEPVAAIQTRRFTVPEGYTLARVAMTMESEGICTAEEFLAAATQGDFSRFPLIAGLKPDETRCFDLEGYLYPDTYEIYEGEDPAYTISRMLEHTEKRLTAEIREMVAQSGYTMHEILTMASIIEKESFGPQQMRLISSVLHNRLDAEMKLQCDVTIVYVEGAIKPFITGDIDRYNSFYNTFKCPGLPAGPICNPGIEAVMAALQPADTDYFYFVTDSEKNYFYAATYEEHQVNCAAAGVVEGGAGETR